MRSFTALVNPISGGGRAARHWAPIAERIRHAGATVREEITHSREHAIELATAAAAEGDVVVAVGGDGLVRDVPALRSRPAARCWASYRPGGATTWPAHCVCRRPTTAWPRFCWTARQRRSTCSTSTARQ